MGIASTVNLESPVPAELLPDFMGKLHYVSPQMMNITVSPLGEVVRFELKPGSAVSTDELAGKIRDVARVLCEGKRDFEAKVLVDRLANPTSFVEDPHPSLIRENHLFDYGQGRYGL